MKKKYIIGIAVIAVFFAIMAYIFTQSSIRYENNFSLIKNQSGSFKATGAWVKEKNFEINRQKRLFTFYMKDADGTEMKVVFNGAMPNNFETATSVVATGRYQDGAFHATEILTKCPSKYEARYKASES